MPPLRWALLPTLPAASAMLRHCAAGVNSPRVTTREVKTMPPHCDALDGPVVRGARVAIETHSPCRGIHAQPHEHRGEHSHEQYEEHVHA